MRAKLYLGLTSLFPILLAYQAWAYPPAVGITSKSKNCLSCHVDNGPWKDDGNAVIDILEKPVSVSKEWAITQIAMASLKQPDGSFLISAHRGETKQLVVVVGRKAGDKVEPPYRNGWIFIDPAKIDTGSLNKFATAWNVDLQASCRLVGDQPPEAVGHLEYQGAQVTVLPMTLRAGDDAKDAELVWQMMLTKGESVKGKPKEGLIGNYYKKIVLLKVIE
jgi:hypothetical protein